ncbi:serine/threonine/tyrosine-interacting protein A [Eurytemora carolleeae]|uniref:serine/threonine/tyrosine-interacting protein A n=1 Tax=Eurytemora carolleeae TaxID=1294199 RepID=UPI000C78F52A|nr:serine/threonine/tyrosine-interacting protein A [Eurytemora carolleeae]|eukprot:XP_023343950.1 serine/threonine/tyrosine-interacting protein A-like [Eurytemora affinis]
MEPSFPNIPQDETQSEANWAYSMRRNMQQILPGLFLGPYGAAGKSKLEELQHHGISHLVCVRMPGEEKIVRINFQDSFICSVIEMSESRTERILPKLKEFQLLLEDCLSSNGKLLVYCVDGMSRSAALVMGFIMFKYGLSYQEVLKYVQQRRFCIQPSPVFEVQLKELEPICRAEVGRRSYQPSRQKREFEDSDEIIDDHSFTKIRQKVVEDGSTMDTE